MKIQCSLAELSKELGVNKSRLAFYATHKLIKPESTVARMRIFNRRSTIQILNAIESYKKDGLSLSEIKKLIK